MQALKTKPCLSLPTSWRAWAFIPVLAAAVAAAPAPSLADASPAVAPAAVDTAAITLEQIMADPDWIGNEPEDPYWSDDGRAVYYEQKRQGEATQDLVRIELESGESTVVGAAERGRADAPTGELGPGRSLKVYAHRGDIFVKSLPDGELRQLTRTAASESRPKLLADGRRVAFERDGQIFIRELDTGVESQPAELRLEKDPAEEKTDTGYIESQQLRFFEILRERKERREQLRDQDLEERRLDPLRPAPPFYLGEKVEVQSRSLSPAADRLLLVVVDQDRDQGRRDQMPSYVTETGYVALEDVRPKVGTSDGKGERLWLLDLASHERHELDVAVLPGILDDPLAELKSKAAERLGSAEKEGEKKEDETESTPKPREVTVEKIEWSRDGRYAAIQIESRDNKDRWTALLEVGSSTLVPIHHLHDEAWINWSFNELAWLDGGHRLWFLSEESGSSQLYLYDADSGQTRRLSSGAGEVFEPAPSPDHRFLYYASNPEHPGITEIYRVEIDGLGETGQIERLTELGGRNRAVVSPEGDRLLILHSEALQPPELYLQDALAGAPPRRLTHTVSEEFAASPWTQPQFVAVPSSHVDRPIHSRLYLPPEEAGDAAAAALGADGLRPAVVFIHGAGYLQNAHQGWSGYFREFMFHSLLTRLGYVVLDMDYRASAGYGRDWRTAIYRHMGEPELEDLADGVDWLVAHHGVDRRRVGAYGGFLTFMAMFKRPELFACGASLRPVTDWAHYNHPYTSNILNTPDVDPEAYERSSPIELAEGLAKPLLICHGMQDDNVLFEDTVRLVQRLIELGKQDWETAIYPLEPHGFLEPSSWLDEYRRILKLFETHLKP